MMLLKNYLLLGFLFISAISSLAQNSGNQSLKTGLTVITHGFSFSEKIHEEWLNFAKAIRQRAGRASIFKNNPKTGKWQPIDELNSNNPEDEIILLYDWAWASNNVNEGYLEAASDHLFALLLSPPTQMGLENQLSLLKKPLHFIGHSRGAILLLQTVHRVCYYLSNEDISIEQFTSLDPHPANPMGDCYLPGIVGLCPPLKDYDSKHIQIKLPACVRRADNYYRQDGTYEDLLTDKSFGPFDGVSVAGLGNFDKKLNNQTLSKGSDKMGGAHSEIGTRWYFGTIDLYNRFNHPINLEWYREDANFPVMGPRETTGYFNSRLGGGELPSEIPEKEKSLFYQPANILFNGDFSIRRKIRKAQIAGWTQNGGDGQGKIIYSPKEDNSFLRLELDKFSVNPLGKEAYYRVHSYFYLPEHLGGEDFCLRFKYRIINEVKGENYLILSFLKMNPSEGEESEIQIGEFVQLSNADKNFQEIWLAIPENCKNSVGALRIALEGTANNRIADIDEIEFVKLSEVNGK